MNKDPQQRISSVEYKLTSLSKELRQLNKRLEDTQLQWTDLIALHAENSIATPKEGSIVYQDNFDHERQAFLCTQMPQVQVSGINSYSSLIDFENYMEQVRENYKSLSCSVIEYETLISGIKNLKKLNLVPLSKLLSETPENQNNVALRHDIDADPEKAIELAHILAQHGVAGSFYLLHSANYYGMFQDQDFYRNPRLATWVKELILSGVEIGIHNDALGMTQNGYQGEESLLNELDYIRSLGAQVMGTVAHNSFPTQKAENFEVFEELTLFERETDLELGTISMQQHGLKYDGNYPLRKKRVDQQAVQNFLDLNYNENINNWLAVYLLENPVMEKEYEIDIWLNAQNQWLVADRRNEAPHKSLLKVDGSSALLKYLSTIKGSPRIVITIHPEFYQSK